MPTGNTEVKSTTRNRATRPVHPVAQTTEENQNTLSNFFKLGESYTSLVLGIVVVIIATVLLLSFIRNKNVATKTAANSKTVAVKTEQTKKVLNIDHKNDTIKIPDKPIIKTETKIVQSPVNSSIY